VRNPGAHDEMRAVGLAGPQLELKLESFESALVAFEAEAGESDSTKFLTQARQFLKASLARYRGSAHLPESPRGRENLPGSRLTSRLIWQLQAPVPNRSGRLPDPAAQP
jgi:hypothetical protein